MTYRVLDISVPRVGVKQTDNEPLQRTGYAGR